MAKKKVQREWEKKLTKTLYICTLKSHYKFFLLLLLLLVVTYIYLQAKHNTTVRKAIITVCNKIICNRNYSPHIHTYIRVYTLTQMQLKKAWEWWEKVKWLQQPLKLNQYICHKNKNKNKLINKQPLFIPIPVLFLLNFYYRWPTVHDTKLHRKRIFVFFFSCFIIS